MNKKKIQVIQHFAFTATLFLTLSVHAMMIDESADPDRGQAVVTLQETQQLAPVQEISDDGTMTSIQSTAQSSDIILQSANADADASTVQTSNDSGQQSSRPAAIDYGTQPTTPTGGQMGQAATDQAVTSQGGYDGYAQASAAAPVNYEATADAEDASDTSNEDLATGAVLAGAAVAGAAALAGLAYLGATQYKRKKTTSSSDLKEQRSKLQSKIDNPGISDKDRAKYQQQADDLDKKIQEAEDKKAQKIIQDDQKKNPALAKITADEDKVKAQRIALDDEAKKLSDERQKIDDDKKSLEDKVKSGEALTDKEQAELRRLNADLKAKEEQIAKNKLQAAAMEKRLAELDDEKKLAQEAAVAKPDTDVKKPTAVDQPETTKKTTASSDSNLEKMRADAAKRKPLVVPAKPVPTPPGKAAASSAGASAAKSKPAPPSAPKPLTPAQKAAAASESKPTTQKTPPPPRTPVATAPKPPVFRP